MRMQAVPRCIQWHIVAEEEEASGLRGAATFASVSGRPRHVGNRRDDDWPGSSQNRGFPARRGPRAEARVGAVDEASTAAREARALPETNPGSEWPQPDSTGNTGNSEEPAALG